MLGAIASGCLVALSIVQADALFGQEFERQNSLKAIFAYPQSSEQPWHPNEPIRFFADGVPTPMVANGLAAMTDMLSGSGYRLQALSARPDDDRPWVWWRPGGVCTATIYPGRHYPVANLTTGPLCDQWATYQHELGHLLGMPHAHQLRGENGRLDVWDCRQWIDIDLISINALGNYSRDFEALSLLPEPTCQDIVDSMMTYIHWGYRDGRRVTVTQWNESLRLPTSYRSKTVSAWDRAMIRTFASIVRQQGVDAIPQQDRVAPHWAGRYLVEDYDTDTLRVTIPGGPMVTGACAHDKVFGPILPEPVLLGELPGWSVNGDNWVTTLSLSAVMAFIKADRGVTLQWTNTADPDDDGLITIALKVVDDRLAMRRFRL